MFFWFLDNWALLFWIVLTILACGLVTYFLGRRFALIPAALGAVAIIFLYGRKIERDINKKRVQDINEKREKAYEKIDQRGTDRDDVIDRLRNRTF